MRIVFEGNSEKDIEIIKKYLEKSKKGIRLSPSDAARWAVAKQADEIKEKK